ncbi:hypothetical protein MMC17_001569 [Xylographa soralifera]|nr:hypothetical protein [Xylographa soralifera]
MGDLDPNESSHQNQPLKTPATPGACATSASKTSLPQTPSAAVAATLERAVLFAVLTSTSTAWLPPDDSLSEVQIWGTLSGVLRDSIIRADCSE